MSNLKTQNQNNKDQSAKIKDQNLDQRSKMEVKYRAFYFSLNIIRFLDSLVLKPSLKIISDQLIRCITSIGANIIEAKSSSSKREFLNYFQIGLKSSNEAKYWLALLRELLPEKRQEISNFISEVNEISKIIGSSVLTLKGKSKL